MRLPVISLSHGGFTLIEILLYMGLSTIMVAVLSNIGIDMFASRIKARALTEVHYNGMFIIEKINGEISRAESILLPERGATSSTLSLAMEDSEFDPTLVYVEDGSVFLKIGESEPKRISGEAVTVPFLEFTQVTSGDALGAVRTGIRIEAYNPENKAAYSASTLLYTTTNIRHTP